MSGYFPDSFVERLREQADILRIVGDYVPLKKAGARHRALCPFHEEKTPSFYVNPAKGIFHCFGCGAGGDVFTFVMKMEKVEFPEALRLVAEKLGIPVPEPECKEGKDDISSTDIYRTYAEAQNFFFEQMWQGPLGSVARDYMQRRGFTEEACRKAGVGYAPPKWDALFECLKKKGLAPRLLEWAGLVKPSQQSSGSHYDTFRGRVTFPIHNVTGKIIAFGGRSLDPEEQPKYLNSPESPVYRKSRALYGLYQTRAAIEKKGFAILVEGYMDWLRLWQEGIDNAVAVCGTAFTEEHAALLKRYTGRVLINFDGDAAGIKAALASIRALLEREFAVTVLHLPDGQDPDDFVKASGRQAYLGAMRSARPALDFLIEYFSPEGPLSSPKNKVDALKSILPYLLSVPSVIERSDYMSRIGRKLEIEDSILKNELSRLLREQKVPASEARLEAALKPRSSSVPLAERQLLLTALEDAVKASFILSRLNDEDIQVMHCPALWNTLLQKVSKGEEISVHGLSTEQAVPPHEKELLSAIAASEDSTLERQDEMEGAIQAIHQKRLERELQTLQSRIENAERQGGDKAVLEALISQKLEILRKKHDFLDKS
jgi:DNA primase